LISGVNANQFAAGMVNQGRNGFNNNLRVSVPRYEGDLNQVSRRMLQGDPRSALAQQQIAGIRNDIQNGQTSMRDLMTRYDAINAAKRDRGLFELGRTDRNAAIRNINDVLGVVRNEITTLGRANPQALRSWQDGMAAYATIHRSNAIKNTVESWMTGPYAKFAQTATGGLFLGGVGGAAYKGLAAYGAGASAGTQAIYKTGQVAYRVTQDPNLRRYYWNSVNAPRS